MDELAPTWGPRIPVAYQHEDRHGWRIRLLSIVEDGGDLRLAIEDEGNVSISARNALVLAQLLGETAERLLGQMGETP